MTHRYAWVAGLVSITLASPAVQALGTPAGTTIANQAQVSFRLAGEARQQTSNVTTLSVAEVVDLDLLIQTPQRLVRSGSVSQPLTLTLTNVGNGREAFALDLDAAVPGDDFDPIAGVTAVVLDTDASGDLTAGDTAYVPGVNDPALAPDESLTIFAVADIPQGLADGDLGLIALGARSLTGSGLPGSTIAGAGEGGTDAVIGGSGATENAIGEYLVGEVSLTLTKSGVVRDPTGGSTGVPGATIEYTVLVSASGTGQALRAAFVDEIPANTTYEPGTLRLNGIPITDVIDGDPGAYSPAPPGIRVDLGALGPGDPAQAISFSVRID